MYLEKRGENVASFSYFVWMAHTGHSKNLFLHPNPHCPDLMRESLLDISTFWWLERNLCLSRIFWILAVGDLGSLDNPHSLCLYLALCPPWAPHSTTLVGNTYQQICWRSNQKKQVLALNGTWSNPYTCTGRAEKRVTPEAFLKTPKRPQLFPKAFSRMSAKTSPALIRWYRRMCNDRARCSPYIRSKKIDP